jgi:hypothetical protein
VPNLLSHELAQSIYDLTKTYGRLPKPDPVSGKDSKAAKAKK